MGGLYDVDKTDATDVETRHAANGKAVRDSGAAVMADKDDGDISSWRAGRGTFHFCLKSREHGVSDSQLVVLVDGSAGTVAR